MSWTPSSYIIAGTNKQNIMGIKAIGNTLTVYANGYQIAEIFDNKYTFGRYGVFVSPETNRQLHLPGGPNVVLGFETLSHSIQQLSQSRIPGCGQPPQPVFISLP